MKLLFWAIFALFVVVAVATADLETVLRFEGATGLGKAALITVWVAFVLYSVYCSTKENLFRSIAEIGKLHWGRQVGIDLYISMGLSIALVALVTGSALATLLWSLAIIAFANQAVLLFVILNFEAIASALSG